MGLEAEQVFQTMAPPVSVEQLEFFFMVFGFRQDREERAPHPETGLEARDTSVAFLRSSTNS